MSNTIPTPQAGDLAVQVRRLSKLLASTVERLEAVESLQAVTVDEQARVVEELERQTERLRQVVERRMPPTSRSLPLSSVSRSTTPNTSWPPSPS
ncbi:hypothetical protein OG439_46335 [Amycolatopsis sp. NBC_01307]|uniref:hypothetical protein n=1 Tax=Amycolatopsis sp. NBC_01307 TaxID=2903561 RepID=UPI002E15AC2E|nr:hypothetical protein OG439_46335 [Amycolatopsis sp. NBC_01307]